MDEELKSFLICRSGTRSCGFPLEHVVEIMRALPIDVFSGMTQFVSGVSKIRGVMTPVVDLARLMGITGDRTAQRFVTVRASKRRVAFAVDSVIGLRQLPVNSFDNFPALLGESGPGGSGFATAIGTLDADLFIVLEASRVIPDSAWPEIESLAGQGAIHG